MGLIRFMTRRYSRLLTKAPRLSNRDGQPVNKDEIGRLGERIAAKHLFAHGCKVLFRNFSAPTGGEVDIVVRHGKTLAFVEVKTRTSERFGRPADAVTLSKQELITRGAQHWLRLLDNRPIPYRCDIVEVLLDPAQPPKVNWIQSAFTMEDTKKGKHRKWT